jgi:hypothetical protein
MLGGPLIPAQRYIADVALEVDESGELAYDEVVVTMQRRAGKTYLIKPVVAYRCGQAAPAMVWLTAQKRTKAVARWLDVSNALLNTPLRPQLKRTISITHETLRWVATGSMFQPFTPTGETEMHGEDPDLVFVDELWSFSLDAKRKIEQGYKPAWSVKPGQAWLLSAAGTPRSEWLNDAVRRGRGAVEDGRRRRIAYFEWSIPEAVGGRPVDQLTEDQLLELIIAYHPRRDHGLRRAFIADELADMRRVDFLRAYGNITQAEEAEPGVFGSLVLERARSGARIPETGRIGLGVSVDPFRRESAIGVAWRNPSGVAVTDEKIGEGTRWLVGELVRLVDQYDVATVGVVGSGPARSVTDELVRAGLPILTLSQSDHAAAGARFTDEFGSGFPSVTWNGSPAFAAAVAGAVARRAPSGIVFESRSGDPITALDARTLAVWAIDHAPEPAKVLEPEIW